MDKFKKINILAICAVLFCSGAFKVSAANNKQILQLQESFAAVAQKAMPAVVTIYSFVRTGTALHQNGAGSGFFITADGFIVTNFHVIQNADVLAVKLSDGHQNVRAQIVGTSPRTDLAVLKISTAVKLPYLKFADTDKLKIGHHAIAIGSPFALAQTMTTGIVSFKGRKLGLHYKEDFIQTDAAINPGNSGGPLLNIHGEVIGVNDCLIAPPGMADRAGNVGLGFAIDGNLARIMVLYMMKNRLPSKPHLGITMREFNKNSPPVIREVSPGSPAARAGVTPGDRILKIGNRKVYTIEDVLITTIALYSPGDEAVFTLQRGKRVMRKKIRFSK